MTTRPRVTHRPVGSHYASPGETSIEISSEKGGCLVSLRYVGERLLVDVHRCDDSVIVLGPGETFDPITGIKRLSEST